MILLVLVCEAFNTQQQGGATDGKVRVLRQGRNVRYSGLPLSSAFQSCMEAQCEACEGNRERFPPPCLCLYPVYAFR